MSRSRYPAVLLAVILALTLPQAFLRAETTSDEAVAGHFAIPPDMVGRLRAYKGAGFTNEQLIALPRATVMKMVARLEQPKNPAAAAEQRALMLFGTANLRQPEGAFKRAHEQTEALRARLRSTAGGGHPTLRTVTGMQGGRSTTLMTVAGIPVGEAGAKREGSADPARRGMAELFREPLMAIGAERALEANDPGPVGWRWLGPGNVGGRTRAILVHPQKPEVLFAAAVSGGIWKTIDRGKDWAPISDFLANINVVSLLMDPANPDLILAGTGESFGNADAHRGFGIFRSRDGGVTFEQLEETAQAAFHYVSRLAITADGATLLAATQSGLYLSTNFRDPDRKAVSFRQVPSLATLPIADVRCHPRDPSQCVVGGRGAAILFSRDGGRSFEFAKGLPDIGEDMRRSNKARVELTYAIGDPKVVYAGIDIEGGEIWRSGDGGATFERRNTGSKYLGEQGWYDNTIWAGDPKRPELVIVGGIDLHRSTDGGRTLTPISDWRKTATSVHSDHHAIVSDPGYDGERNRTVYFGNDGGIYRAADVLAVQVEKGWEELNNNYGVTQIYGAGGNPQTGHIVAGTQDNGTILYYPPAGLTSAPLPFYSIWGGDGGFSAAFGGQSGEGAYFFGEVQFMRIHRTKVYAKDGKNHAAQSYIFEGIGDTDKAASTLFIAPLVFDAADPRVLLAGGAHLWRARDALADKVQWQSIAQPITTGGGRRLISAIATARVAGGSGPSDVIWLGYANGELYVTRDGASQAPTWTKVEGDTTRVLPDQFITRVRLAPKNPDTAYVTFGGFGMAVARPATLMSAARIWRTTDGGRSWSDVSKGLPEVAVFDVAIHPDTPQWLYAATEMGLFASADGGESWWPTNQGPANVSISELFWMDRKLVVATYGRGIYWVDLSARSAEARQRAVAQPGGAASPDARGPAAGMTDLLRSTDDETKKR